MNRGTLAIGDHKSLASDAKTVALNLAEADASLVSVIADMRGVKPMAKDLGEVLQLGAKLKFISLAWRPYMAAISGSTIWLPYMAVIYGCHIWLP